MAIPGDDFPTKEPTRSSERCEAAMRRFEDALASMKSPGAAMESALVHLSALSSYVGDYFRARADEAEQPYLAKDYPEIDHWSNRLKRPSSYKDPVHQSEHNTAQTMHEIFTSITEMPEGTARVELMRAFRTLADELAHAGIYLDQGKKYANKSTMPQSYKDELIPAKPRGHDALYTRINRMLPGDRDR